MLFILWLMQANALATRRVQRTPRESLGALQSRTQFIATLAKRGSNMRRAHSPSDRTVLLVNICVEGAHEPVTDHCWLKGDDARAFDGLDLDVEVSFSSEVGRYRRGRRSDWRLMRVQDVEIRAP